MSQDQQRHDPTPPQEPDAEAPAPQGTPQAAPADDESTVGTGTSIALGCIAATLILIVFALIMLGIMALL